MAKFLQSGNSAPPLSLRINKKLGNVENYLDLLKQNQMEGQVIGKYAIRLENPYLFI